MRPALLALPLATSLLWAAPARADSPNVVADIAPVQSLVAQVMRGVGEPHLLLPPGASPHDYALRPSDAAALASADLVVWIGPDLTPWLEKTVETLAADAIDLPLIEQESTRVLHNRDRALLAAAPTEGETHEHEAHEYEEGAGDHGNEHDHGHDHTPGARDPHVWLDPVNAQTWLPLIAERLAEIDPPHAATYRANAAAAHAELDTLIATLRATLQPVQATPFVVFHDAYQYFETRFDLNMVGAISLGDAARPSPARIAALRKAVREAGIHCALSEPQFDTGLIDTVFEGTAVATQILDPIGMAAPTGPDHYALTLRAMADNLSNCAK